MLVDKLRLGIAPQQQAEIVEPGDYALQFDAVHEENRDRDFLLTHVVEEGILKVLCFFGGHLGLFSRLLFGGRLITTLFWQGLWSPQTCPSPKLFN